MRKLQTSDGTETRIFSIHKSFPSSIPYPPHAATLPSPQMDASTAPPLPDTGFRNPIIALAAALIRAILYLLNVVRRLVAFVTISIPT
jgi:hypothetical protein